MRIPVIVTSLIVLCTGINSCQKEFEDPGDPQIITTVDFKAKINGIQFTAAIYGASIRTTDSVLSLAGKSNDGQQVAFTVLDSGVHVYSLSFNSTSNYGAYTDMAGLAFTSNGGTTSTESGGNLAIISIDTVKRVMSGTFNFKAFHQPDGPQRTIAEGTFNNIPY
jgi:Family of unknown function (DUF6252)